MAINKFFKQIYQQIIGINDSPHKVAGGFAVGVFLGILPGAGAFAAVVLAYILQVNRAWALFKPVMVGFAAVGLMAALVSYGIIFFIVSVYRRRKEGGSR